MAIPVLATGMTPAVDWLSRTLFGSTKYEDPGIGKWAGRGIKNLGISYCRKIAGSSSWSNHAFGNALDISIKPDDSPVGDQIAGWLRGPEVTALLDSHGVSIAHLLWKVPSHHNHIHIDFNPYGTGTPPCAGGPQGPVVKPWPLDEEDDDMTKQEHDALLAVRNTIQGIGIALGRTVATPGFYSDTGKDVGEILEALRP